jgi:hypothetical protein
MPCIINRGKKYCQPIFVFAADPFALDSECAVPLLDPPLWSIALRKSFRGNPGMTYHLIPEAITPNCTLPCPGEKGWVSEWTRIKREIRGGSGNFHSPF